MKSQLFWYYRVSLVKCSYWSKLQVNIITGSGDSTIFAYKGLIRNPEIGSNFNFFKNCFNRFWVINPFHVTGLFQYPLKTSENLWFSDVFRGDWKRPVAWNGLSRNYQGKWVKLLRSLIIVLPLFKIYKKTSFTRIFFHQINTKKVWRHLVISHISQY